MGVGVVCDLLTVLALVVADRWLRLRKYERCFSGRALVDWLVTRRGLARTQALQIGLQMALEGHVVPCDDEVRVVALFAVAADVALSQAPVRDDPDCLLQWGESAQSAPLAAPAAPELHGAALVSALKADSRSTAVWGCARVLAWDMALTLPVADVPFRFRVFHRCVGACVFGALFGLFCARGASHSSAAVPADVVAWLAVHRGCDTAQAVAAVDRLIELKLVAVLCGGPFDSVSHVQHSAHTLLQGLRWGLCFFTNCADFFFFVRSGSTARPPGARSSPARVDQDAGAGFVFQWHLARGCHRGC